MRLLSDAVAPSLAFTSTGISESLSLTKKSISTEGTSSESRHDVYNETAWRLNKKSPEGKQEAFNWLSNY